MDLVNRAKRDLNNEVAATAPTKRSKSEPETQVTRGFGPTNSIPPASGEFTTVIAACGNNIAPSGSSSAFIHSYATHEPEVDDWCSESEGEDPSIPPAALQVASNFSDFSIIDDTFVNKERIINDEKNDVPDFCGSKFMKASRIPLKQTSAVAEIRKDAGPSDISSPPGGTIVHSGQLLLGGKSGINLGNAN